MAPTWLVVPTYDEADTLAPLAAALRERLDGEGLDWRLLVVDDASPDGTGAIADGLAREDERIAVLHRPGKAGLGRAYLAGFARALEAGAGRIVQMDADFSHDPATVPALLAGLDRAGLVLGSRYVPGGRVEDWGPARRVVSRGGCVYARLVLGVGIRDLTGGFKAWRRETLEAIDLPSIRSEGYAFQIELTYRALRAGFTVEEVPIVFRDRREGQSKMTSRIAVEAALLVPRLRGWRPAGSPAAVVPAGSR
jgi:dolichol-phosphate mannosyltransferase